MTLTMNARANLSSKLISSVESHMLLSHQVWSWSNQNYSKNKVFCHCHGLAQFWHWPWSWSFDMMVTRPLILIYANDDDPLMKKRSWIFWGKFKFFFFWRHNVKILLDLESTHQKLAYEVLLDMVPPISKCDFGVSHFQPAARTLNVKVDRPQINQLSSSSFATFTPSLELIW
jgi:hypothetical protein